MRTRVTLALALLLATGRGAIAAPGVQQARLSADLQDHLNAGSQAIDIIVHGDKATVDAIAARYNVVVTRYLSVDGAVLRVTAGQLAAMQQDAAIDHISGNTRIRPTDAVTSEAIGADQVWTGSPDVPALSGSNVVVAVIDSGIDASHAAIKGHVIATKDFTGGDGGDAFGHGTHVAGIIAGSSVSTPDGRDYRGVAWGAKLVNLRVLDGTGSGSVADVVDAIDWAVAHRQQYKIQIINLSLGAPVLQSYRDDPMCEAVERAVRAGLVVVAAAGNYGRTTDGKTVLGSITSPANDPYVLAVGAVDTHGTPERSDDTIAPYSSRGPTAYDLVLKPDLAAPGQHIASAEASNAYLPATYPSRHVTGQGPNAYFDLSGTSMAAAVVSGAAALLLEERGNLKPGEAKAVLQLTAAFMPAYGVIGAGSGELNVVAAIDFISNGKVPPDTLIAAESVQLTGISFGTVSAADVIGLFAPVSTPARVPSKDSRVRGDVSGTSMPGGSKAASIVSGVDAKSIVWGVDATSIVWGVDATSIVWGVTDSSIVWGVDAASIAWGVNGASIVWGVTDSSIVWGIDAASIVWGVNGASIVWGVNDSSIVWGVDATTSNVDGNSIVWGAQ